MKKTLLFLFVFFAFLISSFYPVRNAFSEEFAPPEEYIVEKNDTLWDISVRKLDDAFLWPKLWSVNPHIENPDLIFPGTKILIPSKEELMRMPAMPPVRKKIPVLREQKPEKEVTKPVFEFPPERQQKYIVDKKLYIWSGWIADEFPSVGEIVYSPMNRQIMGKGDIVYLKVNGEATPGKCFFAIRDIKIVEHPITGEKIGHQIKVAGILEVIKTDNDMIKAKITESYENLEIGDGLLPYQDMEPPLIPDTARTPDVSGYIIESHMNSYLLGEGDIIFLDKGENDGLKVGDVFSIFSESPAERPIGEIQIVSLQPNTSGAILLQSNQEVTIGAKWGPKVN